MLPSSKPGGTRIDLISDTSIIGFSIRSGLVLLTRETRLS